MEMNIKKTNKISTVDGDISLNIRKPKRILHFSDGILEEYSDDDLDDGSEGKSMNNDENKINENELEWLPWLLHNTKKTGKTILSGCDYLGESLATLFGITTPKYSSEIDEFHRIINENKKELLKNKQEYSSWQERKELNSNNSNTTIITSDHIITKENVLNNLSQDESERF